MDIFVASQCICMKCVNTFHELISHPSSEGEALTISEEIKKNVDCAATVGVNELFPTGGERNNACCVIGFGDNQAQKEASQQVQGSGVKLCLECTTKEKHLVRNEGQGAQIVQIIGNRDGALFEVADSWWSNNFGQEIMKSS